jgi:hypothetical protein
MKFLITHSSLYSVCLRNFAVSGMLLAWNKWTSRPVKGPKAQRTRLDSLSSCGIFLQWHIPLNLRHCGVICSLSLSLSLSLPESGLIDDSMHVFIIHCTSQKECAQLWLRYVHRVGQGDNSMRAALSHHPNCVSNPLLPVCVVDRSSIMQLGQLYYYSALHSRQVVSLVSLIWHVTFSYPPRLVPANLSDSRNKVVRNACRRFPIYSWVSLLSASKQTRNDQLLL